MVDQWFAENAELTKRFPGCPAARSDSHNGLGTYVEDRKCHDFRYATNPTKCRDELGYAPQESFTSGMRKMMAWYFDHVEWWHQSGEFSQNSGEPL